MTGQRFSGTTCTWFAIAALFPTLFTIPLPILAGILFCLGALAALMEGGLSTVRIALLWTLPLAIPLVAVHGVINPTFAVTGSLFNTIPIRTDGVAFAANLSSKIGLLALSIAVWKTVTRDEIFHAFVSWRMIPQAGLVLVMQSVALVQLVSYRAEAILLAQQARGIPVRRSMFTRILALPAIVVPLVASTLIDADARAVALVSRGLGSGPIARAKASYRLSLADRAFLVGLLLVDGAAALGAILG